MKISTYSRSNLAVPDYEEITDWMAVFVFVVMLVVVQTAMCEPVAFAEETPDESGGAVQECEQGVCVPDETAQRWHSILSHVQCMDHALDEFEKTGESDDLGLTFEPYRIIVTEEGQVFEKESMVVTLVWCDYDLNFDVKPDVQVSMQKDDPDADPFWGFRLRVRLGATLWPLAVADLNLDDLTHTSILIEPFYVGHFHTAAYFSLHSFGPVVGVDLTNNLNFYGGVGASWSEAEIGPVLGLSLSFN